MAWNQVAGILDAGLTFEERFDQVAQLADRAEQDVYCGRRTQFGLRAGGVPVAVGLGSVGRFCGLAPVA